MVVVDKNVAEYQRFHLVHRHAVGRNPVEKLFLERGEKALHPRVVVAVCDAAETLRDAAVLQLLSESSAGVLAATVGVQDRVADREASGGSLERVNAQLLAHIARHAQGENLAIEAIHDRRDIELAVGALDLGNVGQQLSPRPVRAEILMEQVLRRHCLWVGLRQALRTASAFMQPAMLTHQARQPPHPAGDAALRQRQLHPAYAVIVIVGTLAQYLLYLTRKKLVPAWPALAFKIAVIARFAELQHTAQRRDGPFATALIHKCVPQPRSYFFRFLAKKPSASCKISFAR